MRVLFVPVSGPRGSGEYARCVAIARELLRHRPEAEVHFLVSREFPDAARVPFPATLLESSPTFNTPAVKAAIQAFRPGVVVFDNAGRTGQLRAARDAGARVVFISSRHRQRRRAMRLRWLRLVDEHWIAWPEILAGAIGPLERLKLRVSGGPVVRFLDCVMPLEDAELARRVLADKGVTRGEYVLVIPGGGSGHPRMPQGPEVMLETAIRLARAGYAVVLLASTLDQGGAQALPSSLVTLPRQDIAVTAELIRGARLVVCNGGDTLLQALASGIPCVAAAMVPDQVTRLRRLQQAGADLACPLEAGALVSAALQKLEDPQACRDAVAAGNALGLRNGMPETLAALAALCGLEHGGAGAPAA